MNRSVLDIILDEPPAFYEGLSLLNSIYREFCEDLGLKVSGDLLVETGNASGPGDLYDCFKSMRRASMEKNSDIAEVYLEDTINSCDGEAQWYGVLDYHPYAMGFPDVSDDELEILCFVYPNYLACNNP